MRKVLLAGLVVLVAAIGVWLAHPRYKRWKQDRFLAQARGFLARSDYSKAAWSARKALDVNPANVEACRFMAQVAEQLRSPEAISWRSQVVNLQPAPASNRIDLARTALLFGNYPRADQVLHTINESERDTVDFHNLATIVSAAEKDLATAEAHGARALQLAPNNKELQLNLAVLRLQSTDQHVVEAALASLEQLRNEPSCRRDALRNLVGAATRRGNLIKAEDYSRELQAETPPIFKDRLVHLSVLKEANSPEMADFLASAEVAAGQNPQDLTALGTWLRGQKMQGEALHWLLGLPAKTQADRVTAELIADCYADQGDWPRMQALLDHQKWAELDFIRLALLARSLRQQKQDLKAQADWRLALSSASGQQKPLLALLGLAHSWGWAREEEELAWSIIQRFPSERQVLGRLAELYTHTGNTHGLRKVYATQMELDARDIAARNNFATVSLLLNLEPSKARELARENYAKDPKDGILASTYAFSLHLEGRTREALAVMEKFPAEELRKPAIAPYYGLLLAANGERDKAKPYLDSAGRTLLLPEERELVAKALAADESSNSRNSH